MANTYTYNDTEYNLDGFDTSEIKLNETGLRFTSEDKRRLMRLIVDLGRMPTDEELRKNEFVPWKQNNSNTDEFQLVRNYAKTLIGNNEPSLGFNYAGAQINPDGTLKPNTEIETETETETEEINGVPKDIALDKYFNEWYSGKEGTTGATVRGELENVFANQANTEMMLADAAFQQQALQQAQTVKSITDQVRAERMARLKAGMSESQIANQDMQMMMANVNALNDQASMMNQGRLQAQANSMNAKDQAYLAYLEQAQGGAQTGAAYSAANAGDLSYQVRNSLYHKYGSNWTPAQERQEILLWSGQAGIQ